MRTSQLLRTSARMLLNKWERTAATAMAFALALGTFAVFAAVTTAARREVDRVVQEQGALNVLTIVGSQLKRIGGRDVELTSFRSLKTDDAASVSSVLADTAIVVPVRTLLSVVRYHKQRRSVSLTATTPAFFTREDASNVHGRLWSADDARRPVAVIGASLAEAIFGFDSALDKRISVGEHTFIVTGVVYHHQDDTRIIVPLRFGSSTDISPNTLDSIIVRLATEGGRTLAIQDIEATLRTTHRLADGVPDDFSIRDERALIDAQRKVSDIFTLLLPAISAISLGGGGIGILTVLLLGIRERAGEIGLRRAIGATRPDILLQFVYESLLIGIPSAAFGEVIGTLVAAFLIHKSGWSYSAIEWKLLVAALGGAAVFTVVCSIAPAVRGAKVDPATSLRG